MLTAVAAGVAAGIIEYLIHTTVTKLALPGQFVAVLDSTIAAIIAAICVYVVLAAARARRIALLQHLRNVAELNHEVRNALQMIVYSKYLAPQEQAEAVLKSVNRIERTLKHLFPAVDRRPGREPSGQAPRTSGE